MPSAVHRSFHKQHLIFRADKAIGKDKDSCPTQIVIRSFLLSCIHYNINIK